MSFAGSTAGGTLAATVTGNGPAYVVSVAGMTGAGTVVASIPKLTVVDFAFNDNVTDSTSTDNVVTFDPCAAACDDGNPCTVDSCDATLGCRHAAAAAGAACDDGDACTSGDHCSGTTCVAGTAVTCDAAHRCACNDDGYKAVAVTADHACGIRNRGTLWCWGGNSYGGLGDGTADSRYAPVQVGSDAWTWTSIAATNGATCGVRADGSMWCWGFGRLGTGRGDVERVPIRVGDGKRSDWSAVAMGREHSCALDVSGALWCWGRGGGGELGIAGPLGIRGLPTRVGTARWTSVAIGSTTSCAIAQADASLSCWGANESGQAGAGSTAGAILVPTLVAAGPARWKTVGVGESHACAVGEDHSLWCWGSNSSGQLGVGTGPNLTAPVAVAPALGKVWTAVASGYAHVVVAAACAPHGVVPDVPSVSG